MEKKLALEVLGQAFNITNLIQLENDTIYTSLNRNRVKISKTKECLARQTMHYASRSVNNYAIDILTKYGTPEMVSKFKHDNVKVFEPCIMDQYFSTFFIDTDRDALERYVTANYVQDDPYILTHVTYNKKDYWIISI